MDKLERKFELAVRQALKYRNAFKGNQIKIAKIALSVCDVSLGGDRKRKFTLTHFAKALGMRPKTLMEWCKVKTEVYDNLPIKRKTENYYTLSTIRRNLGAATTKLSVRKEYREVASYTSVDIKWKKYLQHLHGILYNFRTPVNLMNIPEQYIKEVGEMCQHIVNLGQAELGFRKKGKSLARRMAVEKNKYYKKAIEAAKETGVVI